MPDITLPAPGVTPGPQYAQQINSAISAINSVLDSGRLSESQLLSRFAAVLVYSNGAYPTRPAGAASVKYIGPVVPTNWLPNDEWVDNS